MNKDIYDILDDTAYEDFKAYLTEDKPVIVKVNGNTIETEDAIFEIGYKYSDLLDMVSEASEFDISGYTKDVIGNQGYYFSTF